MDINALKKRLGEISNKNRKNRNIWKPSNGQQQVRIVPCKSQPDNPFIELKFHYDLNGKTYLSPSSFGRPDPVVEFANKLRQTGDPDDYKLAGKLFPKLRIYAPVIVRGEENEGVRYWGFGKQVYQSLLGIISDEDYGDITDLKEGNDITVEYIPKEETGKNFPETQIRPRPKKTVVGEASLVEAIKNQSSISELWDEPSYDDLKLAMDQYLSPEEEEETTEEEVATPAEDSSATEKKAPKASVEKTADDFDKLFAG